MRWHPDKYSSHKHEGGSKYRDTNKEEERWDDPTSSINEVNFYHKRSVDDSFFIRSTSSLSRTTSRRSHTPMPSLRRNSTRSGSMINSLKRSISRRATSIPTEIEISNATLSKLRSQNNGSTPKSSGSLSRNSSRRSTTPIIFSQTIARKKPQPIEKKLECTLEELCFGAIKKIKITRDVMSDVGVIIQEEETLQINVKPGWKKGTAVTFEGKGDKKPGYLPADITFLIDEKRHPVFKRVGDDLELGVEVPLLKALVGCNISLPLVGGQKMVLQIDDVIYPGYERVIENEGMPKSKDEGQRGDLRLKFLINFPTELSDDKRSRICNILEDCL